MKKGFMLDTNIFNRIIDGRFDLERLKDLGCFFATQVQNGEIKKCIEFDTERGVKLKSLLDATVLVENRLLTETFLWNDSEIEWGDPRMSWGRTGKFYEIILDKLNSIKIRKNNPLDALIGESVLTNNFVLVSCDRALVEVVRELGGQIYNPDRV